MAEITASLKKMRHFLQETDFTPPEAAAILLAQLAAWLLIGYAGSARLRSRLLELLG